MAAEKLGKVTFVKKGKNKAISGEIISVLCIDFPGKSCYNYLHSEGTILPAVLYFLCASCTSIS